MTIGPEDIYTQNSTVIENYFKTMPSGALKIGMEEFQDLKGLDDLLKKRLPEYISTINDAIKNNTKTIDNNAKKDKEDKEKSDKTALENSNKNFQKLSDELKKRLKNDEDVEKRHEEIVKSLQKKFDGSNSFDRSLNLILRGIKTTFKGISTLGIEQLKYVEMTQKLNESGVVLSEGFQSLSSNATHAGMTSYEFAERLKKISPQLAKLNSIVGDGTKVYSEFQHNIRKLGFTSDETSSSFASVMNTMTSDQIAMFSKNGLLQTHLKEYVEHMDKLKAATGKTVETLNQENDVRQKSLRIQTWTSNPKNKQTFDMLNQMGMGDDDTIDYIMTGIPSEKIAVAMAGNRDYAMALQMIRAHVMSGGVINQDFVSIMQSKLKPLYEQSQEKRRNRLNFSGHWAAAAQNDIYQSHTLTGIEGIMKFNANNGSVNKKDKETLGNYNELRAFASIAQELRTIMTMGGGYQTAAENLKKSVELLSKANEKMDSIVKYITMDNPMPQWLGNLLGIGYNLLENIGGLIGLWLGTKIIKGGYNGLNYLFNKGGKPGGKPVGRPGAPANDNFSNKNGFGSKVKNYFLPEGYNAKGGPKLKDAWTRTKAGWKGGGRLGAIGAVADGLWNAHDIYNNWDEIKQENREGEEIAGATGEVIGAWGGAKTGAALGAAALGWTGPGAVLGALGGAAIGGMLGAWGGRAFGESVGRKYIDGKEEQVYNEQQYTSPVQEQYEDAIEEHRQEIEYQREYDQNRDETIYDKLDKVSNRLDVIIECIDGYCTDIKTGFSKGITPSQINGSMPITFDRI